MLKNPKLGQAQRSLIAALLSLAFGIGIFAAQSSRQPSPAANNASAPERTNKQNNGRQKETERMASDDWLALFTPGLVIIGGIQVRLFWVQLRLIGKSLIDAKIAADAAKEAADAAKEGAKATRDNADIAKLAMIASERAYVHHNGVRWISHRNSSGGAVFWRLRPQWINSGNTPTRHLRVYIHYEIRDAELPADYPFTPDPHPESPTLIAPNGTIESGHRDIMGTDLVAIREKTKHLYVWGIARYQDVFPGTPGRITKFCVYVDSVMGNPLEEWNERTNNVELRFLNYHRHNCADEDCNDQT